LYSFKEYLNEINVKGKVIEGKPLWNGEDYIDKNGDINLNGLGLTEFPCIFPEKWDKSFWCNNNKLTSLEGAPKEVGWDFNCHHNNLTTLKGAPEIVGGTFYCNNNQLTSLEYAPKKAGKFSCQYNITKFTKEDVRKVCDVSWITFV